MENSNHRPLRNVIDRLDSLTDHEQVSLRDVLGAFEQTSFLPVLVAPALLVVSPLSGIPLFSTICGLMIALVAGQMVISRDRLWLPDVLARREVAGARIHGALLKTHRLSDFIDRITHDRLSFLVVSPFNRVPQTMAMVAGLMMPILEFVPFSSSILGVSVLCCAVGMLARDGLFVLIGGVVLAIAAAIPLFVISSFTGP